MTTQSPTTDQIRSNKFKTVFFQIWKAASYARTADFIITKALLLKDSFRDMWSDDDIFGFVV